MRDTRAVQKGDLLHQVVEKLVAHLRVTYGTRAENDRFLSALRNVWKPPGALGPDGTVIPENVLTKAPTAELRENQTDQDSLPPYDMLDQILERLVEREEPVAQIVEAGYDRDTVVRVERMLNLAEYKRRQAAPGVKVTLRNFGRDRRYPIVNRFRDPGTPLPKPDVTLAKGAVAASDSFDY